MQINKPNNVSFGNIYKVALSADDLYKNRVISKYLKGYFNLKDKDTGIVLNEPNFISFSSTIKKRCERENVSESWVMANLNLHGIDFDETLFRKGKNNLIIVQGKEDYKDFSKYYLKSQFVLMKAFLKGIFNNKYLRLPKASAGCARVNDIYAEALKKFQAFLSEKKVQDVSLEKIILEQTA